LCDGLYGIIIVNESRFPSIYFMFMCVHGYKQHAVGWRYF